MEEKEKPPEKYSIEWYQLEYARKQAMGQAEEEPEQSVGALVAMAGVLGGTVALLVANDIGAI